MIIIVMGVCACGKTTVGQALASQLTWSFYDGDDYHSESNRSKMAQGIPLTDQDRLPWLRSLRDLGRKETENNRSAIIACSALKLSYRNVLRGLNENGQQSETDGHPQQTKFVYLKLDEDQIRNRLKARSGHFFNAQLIKSQFEILEEPKQDIEKDTLTVDGNLSTVEIVKIVKDWLGN